jgi:hypothetical protein
MNFFSVSHSKSSARSLQVDTGWLVGIKRKKIFGLIRRRNKDLVSYLKFLGKVFFYFHLVVFFCISCDSAFPSSVSVVIVKGKYSILRDKLTYSSQSTRVKVERGLVM